MRELKPIMSRQKSISTSYPRGDRSRESHDRETAATNSEGESIVNSVRGKNISENHLNASI